jgi:hypothetical protein
MSTDIPDIEATLLTENIRLRERVEALEAELADTRSRPFQRQPEMERLRTDTPIQLADEVGHVLLALTHAFVEQLRATADIISSVADEMWRRREDRYESTRERTARPATMGSSPYSRTATGQGTEFTRASRMTEDISAVVNIAIERSLDVPGRVINALSNSYRRS